MSSVTIPVGRFLYHADVSFIRAIEPGPSLEAVLGRQATPPAEGARCGAAIAGIISGSKLNGRIAGMDSIHIRADGRVQVHTHGTTSAGENMALFADGMAIPEVGTDIAHRQENITLTRTPTASSWVSQLHGWRQGTVNPVESEVKVEVYAAYQM